MRCPRRLGLALALLASSVVTGAGADPLGEAVLLDTVPQPLSPVFDVVSTPMGTVIASTFNQAVHLQRLDGRGAPVPGSFVAVAAASGLAVQPAVGAYGSGLWVVWQQFRELDTSPPSRILGVRVGFDGRPIDTTPVVLSEAGTSAPTSVTCTATQCLVGFTQGFVRVSATGAVLDSALRAVGGSVVAGFARGQVAAVGDGFALTWTGTVAGAPNDLYFARVRADGTLLDPGGRLISAAGTLRRNPTIASDGARVFVSWFADASGPRARGQYTQLFDAALDPVSPLTVSPSITYDSSTAYWTGTQWLLLGGGSLGALARFAADGTPADGSNPPFTRRGLRFVCGVNGELDGVILQEARRGYDAGRFASDGTSIGAPAAIPVRYAIERAPFIDSDGAAFVAGWTRDVGPLALQRVTAAGESVALARPGAPAPPLDITAVTLEGGAAQLYGVVPGGGGSTARFDPSTQTYSAPTLLNNSLGMYRVARGPGQRLAFFTQAQSRGGANAVTRLDAAGARLDPSPIALAGTRSVSAAFDGARYIMVHPGRDNGSLLAFSRRLDTQGDLVDVTPRALALPGGLRYGPTLAVGGGTVMIAWVQTDGQVRAARLNADATLRDVVTAPLGTSGYQISADFADREIAIVYDGATFVVVWTADRSGRVLARRVTPAGAVLDAEPIVVASSLSHRASAFAAASDGAGTTLIAHEALDPALGAERVLGTFLRGGVVTPTDAGAPDAPPPADVVAVTDAVAPVDVPTSVDVVANDVVTALDATVADVVTADLVTEPDAAVMDVVTAPDAAVMDVVAPPVDVVVNDASAMDGVSPPSDVVAEPDAGSADAGVTAPPPMDEGGCAVTPGATRATSRWGWTLLAAASIPRRRRRTRRA
ncbi:MAG: hypothetical protein R3A48_13020 [Polyangiales bacterium]